MKHTLALLVCMFIAFVSVPVLADESAPPPPTGVPTFVLGSSLLAGGIGLGIAGMAVPQDGSLANLHAGTTLEVSSIVLGAAGTAIGFVGLVQMVNHDKWVHRAVAGLSVGPTSVGYKVSF
jgi:hypothetical protein